MKYSPLNFLEIEKNKVKIIKILEEFKLKNKEYPTSHDIDSLKEKHPHIFPSSRNIQRHGGIIVFYNSLGLHYIDARTGIRRAKVATDAIKKSQSLDMEFSKRLVGKYGRSNVHLQSPYNSEGKTLHRSDFKVYKPDGSIFFIDLFFAQDMNSLMGCVNLKVKKLKLVEVEDSAPIYFISCNEEWTSPHSIKEYLLSKKNKWPVNIHLIHISEAVDL